MDELTLQCSVMRHDTVDFKRGPHGALQIAVVEHDKDGTRRYAHVLLSKEQVETLLKWLQEET